MICTKCEVNEAVEIKNGKRQQQQLYLYQCRPCRRNRMNKHRKSNPEAYRETQLKFRINNPWKAGIIRFNKIADWTNTHARNFGHEEKITKQDIESLYSRIKFCEDCGSLDNLTVGHLIPLSLPTGRNNIDFLIRQCQSCNSKQGTKIHVRVATEELKKWYPVYVPEPILNKGE